MSITTDRIARKANGIGESVAPLDDNAKFRLFETLSSTLDSLVSGVIMPSSIDQKAVAEFQLRHTTQGVEREAQIA